MGGFKYILLAFLIIFILVSFLFVISTVRNKKKNPEENKTKKTSYQDLEENKCDFDERKKDIRNKYFYLFLPFTAYMFITAISLDDVIFLFPDIGIYLPLVNANIGPQDFAIFSTTIFTLIYIFLLWRIGAFVWFCRSEILNKMNFGNVIKYNFLYLLFFGASPLFLFLLVIWKFLKFQESYWYYYSLIIFLLITYLILIFTIILKIFKDLIFSIYLLFRVKNFREVNLLTIGALVFLFVDVYIMYEIFYPNIKTYLKISSFLDNNQDAFLEKIKDKKNKGIEIVCIKDNDFPKEEDSYPKIIFFNKLELLKNTIPILRSFTMEKKIAWEKIYPFININGLKEAKIPDLNKIVKYFESSKKLNNNQENKNNDIKFEVLPSIFIQNRSIQFAQISNIFVPKVKFEKVNFACSKFKKVDFRDSKFEYVSFAHAIIKESCNFKNSQFSNVYFDETNFKDTDFYKSSFRKVQIKNSYFRENKFESSNILNLTIDDSQLMRNSFKNSNVLYLKIDNDSRLTENSFENSNFNAVKVKNSIFRENNFKKSTILLLDISNSKLNFDKFLEAQIGELEMDNSQLQDVTFYKSKLKKKNSIKIKKSYLENVRFTKLSIPKNKERYISFKNSILYNCSFWKSNLGEQKVKFENCIIIEPRFLEFRGKYRSRFKKSILIFSENNPRMYKPSKKDKCELYDNKKFKSEVKNFWRENLKDKNNRLKIFKDFNELSKILGSLKSEKVYICTY